MAAHITWPSTCTWQPLHAHCTLHSAERSWDRRYVQVLAAFLGLQLGRTAELPLLSCLAVAAPLPAIKISAVACDAR